jgi:predicted TPR repeat methyltransferase
VGDIEEVVPSLAAASVDLVLASDTLPYFGLLDGVITKAAALLRPGGLMVSDSPRTGPAWECSG